MEQHVFTFLLIIEGTTEKVVQFIMPLKSIYNRNSGFIEQKCILEKYKKVKKKKSISGLISAIKNVIVTFSEVPPIGLCLYCCFIVVSNIVHSNVIFLITLNHCHFDVTLAPVKHQEYNISVKCVFHKA